VTGRTAGPVFGFAFFYLLAVGVITPLIGAAVAERRATVRRRNAARRIRTLDGKRLERRVLAARSATGAR
jgi:hypothetical protein